MRVRYSKEELIESIEHKSDVIREIAESIRQDTNPLGLIFRCFHCDNISRSDYRGVIRNGVVLHCEHCNRTSILRMSVE
ncbi:hypothetical protein DENIS_1159 [Desulfonema ishimotonii]|uniref:Uncharacterized protein n=1 Tax=Desulfonema ishimotonii TaxID=45657 RepID=A0A401FTC3_9BACT|nr:hypothetical protein DENIS_1159 [Desulfonema ishimotonii]